MNSYSYDNVHQYIDALFLSTLRPGDKIIDATVGNGNDTYKIAKIIGKEGHIFGFDIQEKAIDTTRKKLKLIENGPTFSLHLCGHENVEKYVTSKVSFIIFNLGYLPSADKTVTTKSETTIVALNKCLKLLKNGGIISVAIYPGHYEGEKELNDILSWAIDIEQKEFNISHIKFLNHKNNPPQLIIIQKKR
ncbi:MAG: methyltransferase domain-containing protein [Tissierellia bacterium]|nr:methyltransferase domain-containing protein [Tissierellia bacterium]